MSTLSATSSYCTDQTYTNGLIGNVQFYPANTGIYNTNIDYQSINNWGMIFQERTPVAVKEKDRYLVVVNSAIVGSYEDEADAVAKARSYVTGDKSAVATVFKALKRVQPKPVETDEISL